MRSSLRRACYTAPVLSRLLAFRPASVVGRLEPRSQACPLSLSDLLGPAAELGLTLPLVPAADAEAVRAALVAAKEQESALGLALPAGLAPEPWFDAVARAADEQAGGLPIFLSAEVVLEGEAPMQVERACRDAWRLVEAGLTHLAVDPRAVDARERARIVAEVAGPVAERGLCVDCVVPLEGGAGAAGRAAELFEELARAGLVPELASVRCPAPADLDAARAQVSALARLCAALAGVPVRRRGPVSPPLLGLLAGSPVKVCEGGEARELSPTADAERREARAYVEASELVERLGAAGSARAIARVLGARLAGEA